MRKLFIMAAAAMIAGSANAQDIKSILKAGTYAEAQGLIKSAEATLSNADKAKAYNKLVDLALEQGKKDEDVLDKNMIAAQMKQSPAPYDTTNLLNAIKSAYDNALICDKFDQMPNEKGKVKPAFRSKNAGRLQTRRNYLLTIGNDAYNGRNYSNAAGAFGLFVDTYKSPIFSESKLNGDNLPVIAFYAELASYYNNDFKAATRYFETAINDTADIQNAIQIAAAAYQNMKDDANYRGVLLKAHQKYPNDNNYFEWLVNSYADARDTLGLKKFAEQEAQTYPNAAHTYYVQGLVAEYELNFAKSVEAYKKAIEADPKYSSPVYNCARATLLYGNSVLNDKSLGANAKQKAMPIYKESITLYEKVKELYPDRKNLWAYPLYNAYYVIGDTAKAAEYEALTK
jgi:tetratricopeptide (TPR) repeat protein